MFLWGGINSGQILLQSRFEFVKLSDVLLVELPSR